MAPAGLNSSRTMRQRPMPTCCGRRAGRGAWRQSSITASTYKGTRSSARPARRSTSSNDPVLTRWRLAPFWFVHRGTDLLPAVFDPPATRRTWILLGAGWLGVIVALALWLRTPGSELREQLRSIQFWSLETCLATGVALGAGVLGQIRRRLDRRDTLYLAILAAAALAVTLFVAPRTNRIYYDEQIYQSIGQNLADMKLAQMCNDG